MEIEEVKKLIAEAQEGLKTKALGAEAKAVEAFQKSETIFAELTQTKELYEANKVELDTLRKDLNTLSANLNKTKFETNEPRTLQKAFNEAVLEKKAEIDVIVANGGKQSGPLILNLKDIGMYNTVEAVGSASHFTITQNTGIISDIRTRITTYLERVSRAGLSVERPVAMWMEMLDETGAAIFIGEGDAKTQLNVRWEEREKKAKKIGVYSKVTTEFLKYLPQLYSHLQNFLMKRVDLATEQQLFTGDDTGDNLAGALKYATDFTGGDLAGQVVSTTGNNWDVILGLISQVRKAFGIVNGIYMKGGKVDLLLSTKDLDGRYILPPGVTVNAQGQISAWGVPLIRTEASLTYGGVDYDFVGGDLLALNVGFPGNMTIQIGLDGNDFTNNKKTILVEQEVVQFVSANDTQVLVRGNFVDALEILESTG